MADSNQAGQKPAEKKEAEKKPIGTLESVVNESFHLAKTGVNLGLAGLIPYMQMSLAPFAARDTAILAGAQIAGDATTNFRKGKKTTSGEVLKSSIVGTSIAVPTNYSFKYLNQIPLESTLGYLGRAAALGGLVAPAFIGMYQGIDYIVRNRTFKGMGNYIKKNFWPTLKQYWTKLFPLSILNVLFVPAYLQVPVAAGLSYLFTLFGAPKKDSLKESEKRDKQSYLSAGASVLGKLANNVFYAPMKASQYLGSAVRDLYKQAPKPAAPSPQPKPA